MNPIVRSIKLKRFRSIPAAEITLSNPTIIVGRNGSGKSNFVDSFSFLAECMNSPLQAVFDRRGGIGAVRNRSSGTSHPPNVGIAITLGPCNGDVQEATFSFEVRALKGFGFEVLREQCRVRRSHGWDWFDRSKKTFRSNIESLKPDLDPSALGLPVVGGEDRFAPVLRTLSSMRVYSIQPDELREMQDPDSGTSLHKNGSNAASVLQEIQRRDPTRFARISEILESIVPNTQTIRAIKHGQKLSLEFTQALDSNRKLRFEAFNMSDGTLRAVGLLAAVHQRPSPSLIAIEEPEATIHPGALHAVLDLLLDASKRMQVIITTHSPELLDAKWILDEHLRIAHWHAGSTRITRISDIARNALREHLMGAGELLRSNVLDEAPDLFESAQPMLFEQMP